MKEFWAVLIDLYQFVFWFMPQRSIQSVTKSLVNAAPGVPIVPMPPVLRTADEAIATEPPEHHVSFGQGTEPTVMYISAAKTACHQFPRRELDDVIGVFSYGDAVTVVEFVGAYAQVYNPHRRGWVHKDSLLNRKSEVWPQLVPDVWYDATHRETIKARCLLDDMFRAGELGLPLQSGEYVTIELRSEHRTIPWPQQTNRIPGTWQRLLRGVPGIHMSVAPATDTIMEWQTETGDGMVAYVRAVKPDQSIVVAAVGLAEPGYVTIVTLSETEWREYRPVFIHIL